MPKISWGAWLAVFLFAGTAWADFCPASLGPDFDQDRDGIPNMDDPCCFGHDRFDPDGGVGVLPVGQCFSNNVDGDANGNFIPAVSEGMCCVYATDQCMQSEQSSGACPGGATKVPCDLLLSYAPYTAQPGDPGQPCNDQSMGCTCYTVLDYDHDGSGPFDSCPLNSDADASSEQPNSDGDLWGDACDTCPFGDGTGSMPSPCFGATMYCGPDSYCVPFVVRDYLNGGIWVESFCSKPLDWDGDFIGDECDNCPDDFNENQDDGDDDGVGDRCDNCPEDYNPEQWLDEDGDFIGDACDECPFTVANPTDPGDEDGDFIDDACDNCPATPNPGQEDRDDDGAGDACDNCIDEPNPWQTNIDGDAVGDSCDMCPGRDDDHEVWEEDRDFDGIADSCDWCPGRAGPFAITDPVDEDGDGYDDEHCDPCPGLNNNGLDPVISESLYWPWPDADGDGIADVCDSCQGRFDDHVTIGLPDVDLDGVPDECDMCPTVENHKAAMGEDRDQDGIADFCDDFVDVNDDPEDPKPWEDLDDDGDGVANGADNCPDQFNEDQADGDEDGLGDACSMFDDYTGAFDCRCQGVGAPRNSLGSPVASLVVALLSSLF